MNNTQPPQNTNYPPYPAPQGQPQGQPQGGYPPPYGGYPPYYPPQPPKKSANVPAIIAGVIALLAVVALVVVLAVPSVRAAIFPPEATATLQPTYTPLPTYTKMPTAAPTVTRPLPTAAPRASDYSSISLDNGILPTGFEIMTEDEAEAMGLDVSSFSSSISAFTDAPVQSVMVAMNSDVDAFQVVVALVAAPMTSSEQTRFDSEISDPQQAADEFAAGMGSGASAWVMDGGDSIGDSSIGMQLVMSSSGVDMGGEVVLSRRGDAMQMVIYLYLDGAQQQVTALNIADAIDYQIQQVQK